MHVLGQTLHLMDAFDVEDVVTEEHINNINFKETIYGMYKAGITNIVPKK